MESGQGNLFNSLVEQSLGKDLPQQVAAAISFSDLPPDVQAFVMRMLALMKRAGYSATDFTPALIRWLSTTVPSILPGAWSGRIPPITLPNRHRKLDTYVSEQYHPSQNDPHVFVDMGCGFPPVTTADTARNLPGWRIYGIDRSFADYVLYDIDGHYACFDQKGGFQYFQAMMSLGGRALYANPKAARNRFNKLFAEISPLLRDTDSTWSETVEKDGNRLIHHHIRDYETDNLTFIRSEIDKLCFDPVKAVRCMNVLIYFKSDTRRKLLLKAGEILADDGILIAGTNGLGIQSRYAVYQKGASGLFPSEFAFSLDNLGHIVFMPWFTIHANDPEAMLLAKLAGALRSDHDFWPNFSQRVDELLKQQSICSRGSDDFLHFPDEEMQPIDYLLKNAGMWRQMEEEGYLVGAVDALRRTGYESWRNPVNDIAIRPDSSVHLT